MKAIDFSCQRCGNCCRGEGYVRLSNEEIDVITAHLRLSINDFLDRYTHLVADRQGLSLIEKADGSCIFLSSMTGECEINLVKPQQCRNFPLIWNFRGWSETCKWSRSQ